MNHSVNDVNPIPHFFTHCLWVLWNGDKTFRLQYPLTTESTVFDIGGYKGEWSKQIIERYDPFVYIFEPVKEYYQEIIKKLKANPKVTVCPFGLGAKTEITSLAILDDASSTFRKSSHNISVQLKDVAEFLTQSDIKHIDLVKINIEGGEYDLLERFIQTEKIKNIDNIQVQFHHFVPNAKERRRKIQADLQKTHRLTYNFPFIWENWQRIALN